MTPNTTLGNPPKTCPLPFADADRLDRAISRIVDELAELGADLAFTEVPDDSRVRDVRRALESARLTLDAAKLPARRLWIEADAARAAGGAQ
jgi:hypothetical protein